MNIFRLRTLIRRIRQRFHPLFYARKSAAGRFLIRVLDRPGWLSIQGVRFKVRGRLLTHGLGFAITGSQEVHPESLVIACLQEFRLRSFWDVGANIGYYTWLMKSIKPEIRCVLFEPLPANVALIDRTLQRNAFPDVTLISAAVSDRSGEACLNADMSSGTTSTLETEDTFEKRHWGVAPKPIVVRQVMIDEMGNQLGRPDFIKVDVEGHEAAALRGAHNTLSQQQPLLLMECNHHDRPCLRPLADFGYTVIDADNLTVELSPDSTNFLCVPKRFASSIPRLLELARQQR